MSDRDKTKKVNNDKRKNRVDENLRNYEKRQQMILDSIRSIK